MLVKHHFLILVQQEENISMLCASSTSRDEAWVSESTVQPTGKMVVSIFSTIPR